MARKPLIRRQADCTRRQPGVRVTRLATGGPAPAAEAGPYGDAGAAVAGAVPDGGACGAGVLLARGPGRAARRRRRGRPRRGRSRPSQVTHEHRQRRSRRPAAPATAGSPRVEGRGRDGPGPGGSRRADPLLVAVGEQLVLPDRHLGLERVDQGPRGGERLAPVGRRRGDDDRGVADARAWPMRCTAATPRTSYSAATPLGDLAQPVEGASGARSSRGRSTPRAAVVVADPADEQRRARRRRRRRARRAPRRRRAGSRGGRPGATASDGGSAHAAESRDAAAGVGGHAATYRGPP